MNKRILYIHRTQGLGAEGAHIRGMIDAFKNSGFHVDILGPPGIDPYAFDQKSEGVKERGYLKRWWRQLAASMPQIIFALMELAYNVYIFPRVWLCLHRHKYTFVYERYALNTFCSTFLSVKYGIPHILEVNDATVIARSRPLFWPRIATTVEGNVFRATKIIVTISKVFKQLIATNYPIPESKILVLPNAVNPEMFILDSQKCIQPQQFGIESGQVILGCAGAFVPWHGLDFMIEALHDLIASQNLFVLLVGDGPVRIHVESIAREYNISERVRFTGFVEPSLVPYYLDLLDICIIPDSNAHCSPMKLFEFMVMGKPIILPDYLPLLDTLEHGKDGLFFKKKDAKSFQNSVESLVSDAGKRKMIGENAYISVCQKYTWRTNVDKVLSFIANCLY